MEIDKLIDRLHIDGHAVCKEWRDNIMNGTAGDYASYREMVGYLHGFDACINLAVDIRNKHYKELLEETDDD
jgi:hypothetical protein